MTNDATAMPITDEEAESNGLKKHDESTYRAIAGPYLQKDLGLLAKAILQLGVIPCKLKMTPTGPVLLRHVAGWRE